MRSEVHELDILFEMPFIPIYFAPCNHEGKSSCASAPGTIYLKETEEVCFIHPQFARLTEYP